MIGMGIETSCDETSIGIIRDGKELLSLRIFSQIDLHKPYGGIVPEIASRAHLEKINLLLEEAMEEAKIRFEDLSYVAVTSSPGLTGSLMIGAQMARCINMVYGTPILPVCHLQSHFAVLHLEGVPTEFPVLGLLLSGGNSAIYILQEFGRMELVGDTMDDALGEAFDKVAGILDLPYPGGPHIEAKADGYIPAPDEKPILPPLLRNLPQEEVSFSFSGLKTAVMVLLEKQKEVSKEQICWNFQNSAFDLVERNLKRAVAKTGIRKVFAGGGVLANTTLQKRLQVWADKNSVELFTPKKKIYCTDNGAMVASLGYHLFRKGYKKGVDFTVNPSRQEIFS
ncbi:putative glycoprotease GCP [Leptospira weilii str. 2006001853]|uniref:tRNA N6-adenosine threonylcarbamoyltransferase n=1 Tax=Leptospira weilii str. 2006001853 TaxID=1001589 RepID=A0A828Z7P9_9LEPT|nr:tRNA (adenosine(37)-N6)-threonylcarbamoyltransferase complex transferase subunit TsaD [Leptospira weilii]EKR66329.1 putative glycoprotease GCP [Leptospira weilii str. 2006001853]EMN43413.1 tRNA threonylcarbamoyl adenosine modification protein YgjD [Leptospira weilii str. LNT 1234]UPY77424.1 tRNA (adenosine(37)-N6)-threonylcarbamoyltransferase complex transferase subunit TsaD [Leptospira weilii]